MTYLERLLMYLEHAREDYQHARTMISATGVRYTRACIEGKRRRVEELEAAVERAREAHPGLRTTGGCATPPHGGSTRRTPRRSGT